MWIEETKRNKSLEITDNIKKQLKTERLKYMSQKELEELIEGLREACVYLEDPQGYRHEVFYGLISPHIELHAEPLPKHMWGLSS